MKKKRKDPIFIPNQPRQKSWWGFADTPKTTYIELEKQRKIQHELSKKNK